MAMVFILVSETQQFLNNKVDEDKKVQEEVKLQEEEQENQKREEEVEFSSFKTVKENS